MSVLFIDINYYIVSIAAFRVPYSFRPHGRGPLTLLRIQDLLLQGDGYSRGPPLSKGELLALYQAAIIKDSELNLTALPQLPLTGEHNQQQGESW